MAKKSILILCTGNSCRSQMAEAILSNSLKGKNYEVMSAGGDPVGYVHPLAIEVMAEAGMPLDEARSKNLSEYLNQEISTVITVCGKVDQQCPSFPGQINRYHWSFDDPAKFEGSEDSIKKEFRRVRDEISLVCHAYLCGINESNKVNEAMAATG